MTKTITEWMHYICQKSSFFEDDGDYVIDSLNGIHIYNFPEEDEELEKISQKDALRCFVNNLFDDLNYNDLSYGSVNPSNLMEKVNLFNSYKDTLERLNSVL